jgi:uncharacterized protein YukE
MNQTGTIARSVQVSGRPVRGRLDRKPDRIPRDGIMSGGIQVDMEALDRVGRGYAVAAGQLREVLGGLDAQVGTLGDTMGIGGASAAYEQMWHAWRVALDGLVSELDGQVTRLLHAIASYDMADNYAFFAGVRGGVELAGP